MPVFRQLPTWFVSHGGGPWSWMKEQFGGAYDQLETPLARMPAGMGAALSAGANPGSEPGAGFAA